MSKHLSEHALRFLDASDEERIEEIRREKWILYPAAKQILDELDDLLHFPERSRMPCRLLIADSNNGKTSLLRRFRATHPPDENPGGEHANIPVLFTIMVGPDEGELYRGLLDCLFSEYSLRLSVRDLKSHLIDVLRKVKPKMILIDEVNTILGGTDRQARACYAGLKGISNLTGIPIVAAGTKVALRGFRVDEQIENRFEPRKIPKWGKGADFRSLLKGFEAVTPLKLPSNLKDTKMAKAILDRTDGLIGEVATLIEKAGTYAIRNKIEKITPEVIEACGYRSPATRQGVV